MAILQLYRIYVLCLLSLIPALGIEAQPTTEVFKNNGEMTIKADEMFNQIAEINLKLGSQAEVIAQLKTDNVQLKADNVQLKADNVQLKTDTEKQGQEITQLKTDNIQLKTDIVQLKTDNAQLKADTENQGQEIVQLKSGLLTITTNQTDKEVVGFTAHFGSNTGVGSNQPMIFDAVLTDVGGGYNTSTGRFTCPLDGLYCFTATMMTYGSTSPRARMWKAGSVVGLIYSTSTGSNNSAGQTVVLHCAAGEQLWLTASSSDSFMGYYSYARTSFSGFLIDRM